MRGNPDLKGECAFSLDRDIADQRRRGHVAVEAVTGLPAASSASSPSEPAPLLYW